jgi:hypothetical protein
LSFIIDCTTSAPDVRTFGAMSSYLSDHWRQSLCLLFVDFFLSGARSALPMGVAPEAIAKTIRVKAQKILTGLSDILSSCDVFQHDFVLNYSSLLSL